MSTATTTTGTVLVYVEARTTDSASRREMGPRDGWVPCGESTGTITDSDRHPDPVFWLDEFVMPELREANTGLDELEESGWRYEIRAAASDAAGERELWTLDFWIEDGDVTFLAR